MENAEKGNEFSVGQKVKHSVFGEGTVIGINQEQGAYQIQFERFETPRMIAYRVKLEKC